MSLQSLRDALPAYAADQKHNLITLSEEQLLSEQQKWGCFLACAYATGQARLIAALESEASARLTPAARNAAKSAATIMAMNTVYYSAVNQLNNHDYRGQQPGLAMTALSQKDVDKIDFELWALAVSAVRQCGVCLNVHEAELHKRNVTLERVQAALRIAAVISAVAAVIAIESAAP
ncbi:carboxymuconolactone decarboxylase family protein [Vitreimonas flagellata]|jgi:alkyl hydroperoxide reductase subunit D|uniref:carboxymuconolactone decarboxylase family protein n=1 Tax=Vitreimonas flagellata TaxID=2560861 RepID=UPI001075859F|nr:carboxymuconolactone decarboxylase family protein [Vitreimonas flagellata]